MISVSHFNRASYKNGVSKVVSWSALRAGRIAGSTHGGGASILAVNVQVVGHLFEGRDSIPSPRFIVVFMFGNYLYPVRRAFRQLFLQGSTCNYARLQVGRVNGLFLGQDINVRDPANRRVTIRHQDKVDIRRICCVFITYGTYLRFKVTFQLGFALKDVLPYRSLEPTCARQRKYLLKVFHLASGRFLRTLSRGMMFLPVRVGRSFIVSTVIANVGRVWFPIVIHRPRLVANLAVCVNDRRNHLVNIFPTSKEDRFLWRRRMTPIARFIYFPSLRAIVSGVNVGQNKGFRPNVHSEAFVYVSRARRSKFIGACFPQYTGRRGIVCQLIFHRQFVLQGFLCKIGKFQLKFQFHGCCRLVGQRQVKGEQLKHFFLCRRKQRLFLLKS